MRVIRIGLVFLLAAGLWADVKTQEKSQFKMEGMIGRMAGLFGGKAMKEGTINTVAVKGNRKMTVNEQTGQIIDLDEEKIYDLDMKDKRYTVTTFAEFRRRMQEAQERAAQQRPSPAAEPKAEQKEPNMEIDFSLKESGQKRNINGYDCREVVAVVTVREKGKTLEESGGMVMTSNMWLAPEIRAMKEIAEFDMKYAQKLAGPVLFGAAGAAQAQQMAALAAMYPMMKDALGKFQAENVNMDGTAILTVMTMESVASAQQAAAQQQEARQQQQNESTTNVTSLRGLGGLLGRKIARQKAEEAAKKDAGSEGGPKNRATLMTMNHELVSVSTGVAPADVAIPAGFREKK